ncbi:sensor histidine kinase [Flavobacterium sp. NRK1]|uniref:sensor histidine kinase n=1 Tax=Flavobacterium sp. NRK1 TaxID=2954929 RepID=UPI0035B41276
MSLSLVGIILVQLYWVNSSLKTSGEQFQYNIQEVLEKTSFKIRAEEEEKFREIFENYEDSTGHKPSRVDLYSLYEYSKNKDLSNVIYSDRLTGKDYRDISFDSLGDKEKKVPEQKLNTGKSISGKEANSIEQARVVKEKLYLRDFGEYNSVESWLSTEKVREMIAKELEDKKVGIDFEFAIFKNDMPTKIKSKNFSYLENIQDHKIFEDDEGPRFALLINFPKKETFLFRSIFGITLLSIIFTLIIIIAYLSAINQLIKQKQISEIKTDFINNMTHEFKTPIATINLALDAIKNPKIFNDGEKVQRYLQMIRDENKRMHAQVENVLQISKLDRKELEITKDQADIHDIIEEAIEHVYLIIEARQGSLTRHFDAQRTTALLNDVHFTNVLVNILDNAIKYSPDEPVIDIYTENVKDFILIKIKDNGLGMSKVTQKRIFEKFYREHTGDIHNVKGHGLGLAYVKRIIEDHNCHIYVESEKGKGSTFIIKMPLIN